MSPPSVLSWHSGTQMVQDDDKTGRDKDTLTNNNNAINIQLAKKKHTLELQFRHVSQAKEAKKSHYYPSLL